MRAALSLNEMNCIALSHMLGNEAVSGIYTYKYNYIYEYRYIYSQIFLHSRSIPCCVVMRCVVMRCVVMGYSIL